MFTSELKAEPIDKNYYRIIDGFCLNFYINRDFFKYHANKWCVITVYPGAVTDFASVPKFLRHWFPNKGKKVAHAAVVHDLLYQFQLFPRITCDRIFLYGLAVLGMKKWRRELMYLGVRAGGWKPYTRYRRRHEQGCAPLNYYTIAGQPVEVTFFDSFLESMTYTYETEKIISRKEDNK